MTHLDSKLTNINAIVGQNGAGKSTLLDIIRSSFIQYNQALPKSKSLIIVESDETDHPIILRNDFNKIFLETNIANTKRIVLNGALSKRTQTIYYSPHYDYKFHPNFDDVDNHDLSFDRIVEKDLANLNEKDSDEQGWPYSPSQELLFKNSIRQIEFLSSQLVEKHKIFQDLFHLQSHYEPVLYFRGYKEREKDWNTPSKLRRILSLISEKLENELNDWHHIRKRKGNMVLNQVEINRYILKRNVIKDVISLIYKQMERKNSFLEEGDFPYDKFTKDLESFDAFHTFVLFVKNSSIKLGPGSTEMIFNKTVLEKLITKIYEAIEKAEDEESVTNKTLRLTREDAIDILQLQRQFLNDLNIYYHKSYSSKEELIVPDSEKIEEFINYMPFSRRLSSGENALLNLFSRIYDFLTSNLKTTKFREPREHYILLLDEADLTFHLSWKKRYVKALLKTLPYFFDELENKPSLQIIFTTHDPLTLSDLPNTNVVYIERKSYEDTASILDYDNKNRPLKTFGANISDLITDSFFIENSLIGDFAFDKIHDSIEWLTQKDNMQNAEYHKKLIKLIDEPIVQRKLAEMYDDKMNSDFQLAVVNEQIIKLEELRSKLES